VAPGPGRLSGKVALVTGAARGTGEAVARLFAAEGSKVILGDLLDAEGERVAGEIGDAARYVHLDVTSETDWQRAVEAAEGRHGALHVLVNNAAVLHMAAIGDTSLADFERVVRVNQTGTFLGIRAAAPALTRAGGGSIVNISSVDGLGAKNGLVAYASSKWAVRGITKVAALELGRFGIRVNAVCPEAGSIEMIARYLPPGIDPEKIMARSHPILPLQAGRPQRERILDVARMVLFLASDESGSCTGGDFPVEGGNTAGKIVRGAPGA
jgi:3alpha(or 20beta)-hydroxysteroid dehydrogenase